jgi:hypothetical protein
MARPKKKAEPVHVVRRWESSPVVYGFDSRFDRKENPDYHPAVSLTSKGTFVNDAGRPLDPKEVPDYIKAAAKGTNLDVEYHPPKKRSLSMADAMLGAGVQDTEPDAKVRAGRRGSREVYA